MLAYKQIDINRFYNKINIITEGPNIGCWDINYARDKDGYTIFHLVCGTLGSHRFMYQIHHQEENIDGLFVCHSCDNPWCVNPDHLWLGTNEDNMKDMVSKNRQAQGGQNGNSKLSDSDVEEMLLNVESGYFRTCMEIMNHYHVGNFTVYGILNENYWTHISKNFDMVEIKKKLFKKQVSGLLSNNIVRDIRKRLANGEMQADIARFYSIHDIVVSGIKRGKTYKNVV
jgi:hypothetical protein